MTVQTPQAFRRDVLERAPRQRATTPPTTRPSSKCLAAESWSFPVNSTTSRSPCLVTSARRHIDCVTLDEDRSRTRRPSRQRRRVARRSGWDWSRFPTRRDSSDTPTPTSRRTRSVTPCSARRTWATSGDTFPTPIPPFAGASSRRLLEETVELVAGAGLRVESRRTSRSSPNVRSWPTSCRDVRANSRRVVGALVTVKATTAEGLGALGRVEGIAASAVVLFEEIS